MAKRRKEKASHGEVVEEEKGTNVFGRHKLYGLNSDFTWGSILLLAVVLTYQPIWYAGFVWDDASHLTANPCIVGPLGLKEIWTTSAALICSLVLTVFWLEHAVGGLAPLPYHLVNVQEHGLGAILLWRILRKLRVLGAWLGAALWALHPLQVESVAWVCEMKNTQSSLFYLLTVFFPEMVRAKREQRPAKALGIYLYVTLCLFASLAMASKFSTAVLPAVLVLCACWMESRCDWRILVRLAPIFILAVIAVAATFELSSTDHAATAHPPWAGTWVERVARTGDVIWFYLGKLLWPYPLMMVYPRWLIDTGQWTSYLPLLAVIGLVLGLWLKRGPWGRPYFLCPDLFFHRAVAVPRAHRPVFLAVLLRRRSPPDAGRHGTIGVG
jgi:protein O-mannosyl-transferase